MTRHGWMSWLIVALLLVLPLSARAQFGDMDSLEDDILDELEQSAKVQDLDKLTHTHLSSVARWEGVVQPRRGKNDKADAAHWRATADGFVSPVDSGAATALVRVPQAGKYRVWVRYEADTTVARPVTLALSGANGGEHVFGSRPLSNQQGKEQEESRPIRFESEYERLSFPSKPLPIWEYWDADLKAGDTRLSLTSKSKQARVHSVLITQSTAFNPSLSDDPAQGNLNRTYYRYRVLPGKAVPSRVSIGEGLTYHWRRIERGATEPLWYSKLDRATDATGIVSTDGSRQLKPGEWSNYIDATFAITSPGPYATGYLSVPEVSSGQVEIQLAWWTHPAAAVKTIRTGIERHRVVYMVPMDGSGYTTPTAATDADTGAWGMRVGTPGRTAAEMPKRYLDYFESPEDVHSRYVAMADNAVALLGIDNPVLPKHIIFYSGAGGAPSAQRQTVEALRKLGLNWLSGPDRKLLDGLGIRSDYPLHMNDALFYANTHDPLDPTIPQHFRDHFEGVAKNLEASDPDARQRVTTLKMGDEIGAIVGPSHIIGLPDCMAAYHDYLRDYLAETGREPAFFGVEDVTDLPYMPSLPDDAGRFERRVYVMSARFKFVLSAMFYRTMTEAAESVFPNIRTFCNFSPHPPMFGGHMNGGDWFFLTRLGGASMAWAEDWATGGSWGMAGIETVGYYAAMVDCAARKEDEHLPSGFYNVITCGSSDRKIISQLSHGIFLQMTYSFGPQYAGAEFSNFWSDTPRGYEQIARGIHAVGPADEIIRFGKREPARIGLLYNRTHEVFHGGEYGYQTDRLLTYIALRQAGYPVDIVLVEDLTPERLADYKVLYMNGRNVSAKQLGAVEAWVEQGGTLVGTAGAATHDEFNEPLAASADLFGATQAIVDVSKGGWHALAIAEHKPIDRVTVKASDVTQSQSVDVVGLKVALSPTNSDVVATYADGSPAAVTRRIGNGRTLLLGYMPGMMFKGNAKGSSHYVIDNRPIVTQPAVATLARPRATFTCDTNKQTEVTVFEHETGIAVTLNRFGPGDTLSGELRVATDRKFTSATSSLHGPLEFKRDGGDIVVQCPTLDSIDVVVLK